jgi:hypothetical protein
MARCHGAQAVEPHRPLLHPDCFSSESVLIADGMAEPLENVHEQLRTDVNSVPGTSPPRGFPRARPLIQPYAGVWPWPGNGEERGWDGAGRRRVDGTSLSTVPPACVLSESGGGGGSAWVGGLGALRDAIPVPVLALHARGDQGSALGERVPGAAGQPPPPLYAKCTIYGLPRPWPRPPAHGPGVPLYAEPVLTS